MDLPNHVSVFDNLTVKCCPIDIGFKKSSVNWMKLMCVNLLTFGLELCTSASFTYIPPVMLKNGFTDKALSRVMAGGPFISFILVPIIGHWSDRCQSRFGRRRPFILVLGLIMAVSMFIIPFNEELSNLFGSIRYPNLLLAIGVILLDFSSQALTNPCKSLIADMFPLHEDNTAGFNMYSFMFSLGGCIGYLITAINWADTYFGLLFGGQEKAVFTVLAIVFLFLLIANLYLANETPFVGKVQFSRSAFSSHKNFEDNQIEEGNYPFSNEKNFLLSNKTNIRNGFRSYPVTNALEAENVDYFLHLQSLNVLTFLQGFKVISKKIFFFFLSPFVIIQKCKLNDILLPPVLRPLFLSSLFGWMGIMCHDMYYSDFVGQVIYRGEPHAERESTAISRYDEGVRMASWGLLFHCFFSAVYTAGLLDRLVHRFGKRKIYIFGMTAFSLSLLGTILSSQIVLVNIFAALSGLGLATLNTVPYSLITEYYSKKEVYYCDNNCRGIGQDMAVLDASVYLSQIIPLFIFGYIVEYTKSSSSYMIVAAFCAAAGTYLGCFVKFTS